MPAPSTSTFALRGRPESAGRLPASPAIKSHEESAVITSDELPTAPKWPRNRRRVGAERERDERVVAMPCSESAAGGWGAATVYRSAFQAHPPRGRSRRRLDEKRPMLTCDLKVRPSVLNPPFADDTSIGILKCSSATIMK